MTRGILIAGVESALSMALEAEAAKRVEQYTVAFIPSRQGEGPRESPPEDRRIPLIWNPGSFLSARAMVLGAQNRMDHIDDAILVCVPPLLRRATPELALSDIETMVNDYIKGWFFLVKELSAIFKSRNRGTLSLAMSEVIGGGREEDMIGPVISASFRAFTQSLLSASFNKPFQTLGFSAAEGSDSAAFAAFIFKVMEEGNKRDSGKWHKFSRLGIFNR